MDEHVTSFEHYRMRYHRLPFLSKIKLLKFLAFRVSGQKGLLI